MSKITPPKKRFNPKLRAKLFSLRMRDSLFNVEYHQFQKGEKLYTEEYLISEAKGIYEEFKNMGEEYGFPSEKNVGHFYLDNQIQISPLHALLIHIHQRGEPIIKNEFTYEELVCEGHLSEYDYGYLVNSLGYGKGYEFEMKDLYEKHKK